MKFALSEKLAEAGKRVIADCHQELAGLRLAWVFRDKASKSNGKVTLGKAIAVNDRDYLLHRYDAIIEIALDMWELADDKARDALLDHELSHLSWTGALNEETHRADVVVIGHDIEEFAQVLERRGCWHPALRGFLRAGEAHYPPFKRDNEPA